MGCFLKPVLDGQVVQLFLICHQQLQKGHPVSLVKSHGFHIQNVAVLIHQPCLGAGRMGMVKLQNFFRNAASGLAQGWNGAKKLPEVLIGLLIEHTSAAAYKALLRRTDTVIASPKYVHALVNRYLVGREPAVPDQIRGSSQGGQASAYQISFPVAIIPVIHHRFLNGGNPLIFLFLPAVLQLLHCHAHCCSCCRSCQDFTHFFVHRLTFLSVLYIISLMIQIIVLPGLFPFIPVKYTTDPVFVFLASYCEP